ncbi:MAG: DUF2914 domain-containing protein [Nannocystaceae bacterium]
MSAWGERRASTALRRPQTGAWCVSGRPLALSFGLLAVACGDAPSEGRAAVRLPSQTDGHAMVRLPAAGTAGAREALNRQPKKKRAAPVTPTTRDFGADLEPATDTQRSPRRALDEADARADEAEDEGAGARVDDAEDDDEALEAGARRDRVDVREPPEGTPAAIAKVFRRLPVSVHDGAPVGGIGASGVHVDRIWLGSKRSKDGCGGKDDGFSIGGGDEVNVCFRVVHGRQQEDVDVIWERDGDLAQRRRGVTILPLHAYRTRSYLVLRNEYVGSWRVRIFSEDHVELATKTFNVVE